MIQQKTPKKIKGERKKRQAEKRANAELFKSGIIKTPDAFLIKQSLLYCCPELEELKRSKANVCVITDEQWQTLKQKDLSCRIERLKGERKL